ncbi:hypothetical protein WJU23_03690 [Prosthecobacter sp. SYSU 5D2]|uniref:hypothetical protein n=1 Tax=Prosthecobacter sp. SYSU 5D2 TaxID=3134134 RepID=UPI0031FF1CA0
MIEQKTSSSEMTAQLLDNLEFLRRIRGRFRNPMKDRIACHFIVSFFGIAAVVFFYLLLLRTRSQLPFTNDDWAGVLIVFSSIGLASFFWVNTDQEWHFTGLEIIAYRGGKLIWRIPIDSITEAGAKRGSHNVLWMHLHANGRKYSMPVVPELSQECQRVLDPTGASED